MTSAKARILKPLQQSFLDLGFINNSTERRTIL